MVQSAMPKKTTAKKAGRKVSRRPPQRKPAQLVLTEIKLDRFKAAYDSGPVKLKPFTVLIGRNGSGKSSIIEALQWVETTMRENARDACARYFGVRDLINQQGPSKGRYFKLQFTWKTDDDLILRYGIKVKEAKDRGPEIVDESLATTNAAGERRELILTEDAVRYIRLGVRSHAGLGISDPERLALDRSILLSSPSEAEVIVPTAFTGLQDFWRRAVFLRLNPNQLAQPAPMKAPTVVEPLLREEGENLAALIGGLTDAQRDRLAQHLQDVLPDVEAVKTDKIDGTQGEMVFYLFRERLKKPRSRSTDLVSIPAWMLSEGTRRLTAFFALLLRDPAPSLICIEELENGLDPWTVLVVLRHLQSAAERGIQVIVTTHSPWLLDHVEIDSILHVRRERGETVYEPFADRVAVRAFQGNVPPGAIYVNTDPGEDDGR
jgi:predicted ATPase